MKNFENITIGELKKLHDQFREQNPEIKTALELLDDLAKKTKKKPKSQQNTHFQFKDIYPNQRK